MTIVTPPPAIDRDRYGRPMVLPTAGGKKVAYSRCTTFIDCIEDKFNLQQWDKRMVALGLASRPDLLLSVTAHRGDKQALNRICDDAKEAAAASAAATTGTALHALTELVDRGEELPVLPETSKASLAAYAEATAELKSVFIEQFCVLDTLRIGGTPDRVVSYQGQRYIADIKTGSVEWGTLKIAAQLAVYARSYTYDIATGKRGRHDADTTRGIIIHLPSDPTSWADPAKAECHLHWVDLHEGWEIVKVARQVREKRTLKFNDLCQPFGPPLEEQLAASLPLDAQIRACTDADAVRALWAAHESEWDDSLTDVAKSHIAKLPAAV